MRDFLCPNCGQHLALENSVCLSCGSALGFSLDERASLVITSGQDSEHGGAVDSGQYHLCANLHVAECNWLVKVKSGVSAPRTTPIAGGYDPNSSANRAGQSPRALPRYGRAGRHPPQGNPAQHVIAGMDHTADHDADLVVVGSSSSGLLGRVALGRVPTGSSIPRQCPWRLPRAVSR